MQTVSESTLIVATTSGEIMLRHRHSGSIERIASGTNGVLGSLRVEGNIGGEEFAIAGCLSERYRRPRPHQHI